MVRARVLLSLVAAACALATLPPVVVLAEDSPETPSPPPVASGGNVNGDNSADNANDANNANDAAKVPKPIAPSVETPTPTPAPAWPDIPQGETQLMAFQCPAADESFTISHDIVQLNCPGTPQTFPPKRRIEVNAVAKSKSLMVEPCENPVVEQLKFLGTGDGVNTPISVASNAFAKMPSLQTISFTGLAFPNDRLVLSTPPTVTHLELDGTTAKDISLILNEDNPTTGLRQLMVNNNAFTTIPTLFLERAYSPPLDLQGEWSFEGSTSELNITEYQNAKANLAGSPVLKNVLTFHDTCPEVPPQEDKHLVCMSTRAAATDKDSPGAIENGDASGSSASTSRGDRDSSSDSTLTIIIVVIALVAAGLAYFIARRFFCMPNRAAASPTSNDRTISLIEKGPQQTPMMPLTDRANSASRVSFISNDDVLRPFRLETSEISVTKSIGTGHLWTGEYQGRKVMIKRVDAESHDSYVTKNLATQARSVAPLQHPNIVSLIGVAWVQGTDFGMVAEFLDKNTLKSVLMDIDTELDLQAQFTMCLDIANGLAYLHHPERNLYMRRLSSRKVMVNSSLECKLNLFECQSCTMPLEVPEVFGVGEMAWWAPELITRSGPVDPRMANMFALGVLMSEVFTRVAPYAARIEAVGNTLADLELTARLHRQERLVPHENRRPMSELPAMVRDIIERCLSYSPKLRPTANDVVACLEAARGYSERMGSTTSL